MERTNFREIVEAEAKPWVELFGFREICAYKYKSLLDAVVLSNDHVVLWLYFEYFDWILSAGVTSPESAARMIAVREADPDPGVINLGDAGAALQLEIIERSGQSKDGYWELERSREAVVEAVRKLVQDSITYVPDILSGTE